MAPTNTKKVLEEFIYIYRSHPCLWMVKDKDYHDREKRNSAYQLLIDKLKEIEADADKAAVVKKINNFRSNVRKERRKYEQSIKSGASVDDVYHPKLWYYDLFEFLRDQDTARQSSSNLDSEEENSCEVVSPQEVSAAHQENQTEDIDINQSQSTSQAIPTQLESAQATKNISSRPPKPAKKIDGTISNELLVSVRDHFKRPRPMVSEDRCDVIGNNVAMKLRALDKRQTLVAEKLINDLLFEAEMGHLAPEHAYISMRDVLRQHQQSYSPAQHNRQRVHYQFSPNYVSSPSPSPPYSTTPSPYSENLSQPTHTHQLPNSTQITSFQELHSYSKEMRTGNVNQSSEIEGFQVPVHDNSAATFLTNFQVDVE